MKNKSSPVANTFEIVGDDLLCTRFEGQVVEWKLAERFREQFEFEEVDFLNDINETTLITSKLLDEALSAVEEAHLSILEEAP
jgi:hypothetical protein